MEGDREWKQEQESAKRVKDPHGGEVIPGAGVSSLGIYCLPWKSAWLISGQNSLKTKVAASMPKLTPILSGLTEGALRSRIVEIGDARCGA